MATKIIKGLTSQLDRAARTRDLRIKANKWRNQQGLIEVINKERSDTVRDLAGITKSTSGINPVLKDGVLSEVKARPAIEKVKKPTDFKYNKVSGRKASAQLRKAREQIDEDAMRDAEDELGVYNPNKHVQILEENKRAISDLENQIESMNRRDGNRAWSLGHIISLENGGLHIRENMIIEPGRSRDGRRGNSSRSHLTDISKEKAEEMGIPTTYKAWMTQKYFPGARNISKELGDDGMLKVMDGADWQSVLDERAANGTTI